MSGGGSLAKGWTVILATFKGVILNFILWLLPHPQTRRSRSKVSRSEHLKGADGRARPALSEHELGKLDETIEKSVANILNARLKNGQWEYGSCLGIPTTCQYYLFAHVFLGPEHRKSGTKFVPGRLRKVILERQLPDGSWQPVPDVNSGGDVTATLFCYWALKAMGEDINSEIMHKARQFVLDCGGMTEVQTMAKIFLALTCNMAWGEVLPFIPLFMFSNWGLGWLWNLRRWLPQWIPPHMVSIAYLRYHKCAKWIPQLDVSELRCGEQRGRVPRASVYPKRPQPALFNVQACIEYADDLTQCKGSLGPFTLSSLLAVLMYEDYSKRYKDRHSLRMPKRIERCLAFCEGTYFDPPNPEVAYLGMSMYGDFWDTCLCGIALLKAGVGVGELFKSAEYLEPHVAKDGGLGFSSDFDYYPDCDCTAEMVIFFRSLAALRPKLSRSKKLNRLADRGVAYLRERQNRNGGWAAFDKDMENTFIMHAIKAYCSLGDSAELDDPACVDITAHVLEVFGLSGVDASDPQLLRAIEFMRRSQEDCGAFQGRWGTNGVYGTGNVLVGLAAVKYDMNRRWVQKAADWLVRVQNLDGGWGESTVLSFRDPGKWLGKGVSTPTQTAWALLGLMEMGGERYRRAVDLGIRYLNQTFEEEGGKFVDKSSVAPGHRNMVTMLYFSYAPAFSLQALAKYKAKFT